MYRDVKVYEMDGRWRVARRDAFGRWYEETIIGYRSRERAERRARRVKRRWDRFFDRQEGRANMRQAESEQIDRA